MDARGLMTFIITVHELAVVLGVLVGALIAALGFLLLRNVSAGTRAVTVLAFALGSALITLALTSKLFHVSALDVEVVRVSE